MLTALSCDPGSPVLSGRAAFSIDGVARVALSTAQPLWRDLSPGARGPDVTGLQQELARLGASPGETGSFDARTAAAVRQVLGREQSTWVGRTLPRALFVWLPPGAGQVTSCPVGAGAVLTAGEAVVQLSTTLSSASVSPLDRQALGGPRSLTVGAAVVPFPESGRSSDPALITALEGQDLDQAGGQGGPAAPTAQGSSGTGTMRATAVLTTPVAAYGVPASAVLGTAGATCVVDSSGDAHGVRVVGSTLGKALVTFSTGSPPTVVRVAPPSARSC